MKRVLAIVTGAAAFLPLEAQAFDPCNATMLRDVTYYGASFRKGEVISRVTQYRRNGSEWIFCAHGGSCVPEKVKVGNNLVFAVRLDNCRVDFGSGRVSMGEPDYELRVIRSKFTPAELRALDLEHALLRLGASEFDAQDFGSMYSRHPNGACGRLARSVLAGDRRAVRAITNREIDSNSRFFNPCIREDLRQ